MLHHPGGKFRARSQPEFVEDVLQVVICRAGADDQALGDLAIAEAPGDQGRHLSLAWCQRPDLARPCGSIIDLRFGALERTSGCLGERHTPAPVPGRRGRSSVQAPPRTC
jgi:hypothetical protein